MTNERKATIAKQTLWLAIGFNAGAFVWNVIGGFYGLAVVQSIVLVALTAWLCISPKIHARLDAIIGHAVAQQRMADLGLQVMEAQIRSGRVQVDLVGEVKPGARMN